MQICNGPDCEDRMWPVLRPCGYVPEAVRPLKSGRFCKDGTFAHMWDQRVAERVWKHPESYSLLLSRQYGIVAPAYALSPDMPMPMVQWNVYRGRAIARWLQTEGMRAIPSATWLDEDTFDTTLAGLPRGGTIAVTSDGMDACRFERGLVALAERCEPDAVLVHGPRLRVEEPCEVIWERGHEVADMDAGEVEEIFGVRPQGI